MCDIRILLYHMFNISLNRMKENIDVLKARPDLQ